VREDCTSPTCHLRCSVELGDFVRIRTSGVICLEVGSLSTTQRRSIRFKGSADLPMYTVHRIRWTSDLGNCNVLLPLQTYIVHRDQSICTPKMAEPTGGRQSAYLPPEIWQRILPQHTDPNELWTVGRQVCSMWRSEIPKIFAEKYLENPDMVQIYFDCGTARIEGTTCMMGAEMVFNRYEGKTNNRCVFTEHSTTGTRNLRNSEAYNQHYERAKFRVWQSNIAMYLGADPGAMDEGGRFDLPPYQIRIKSKANDSELPNLEYDFQKREISFEWEGMFARFYREAAKQDKREYAILSEATEWLDRGDCSIVGALALTKRHKEARRSSMKDIRRNRVKEWYLEKHDWEYKDRLFDEEEENKALDAIEEFEMHGDFTRCAEDAESRQRAEAHAEKQQMMEMIGTLQGLNGPGEMDEDALLNMFMRMSGGPPGNDESDSSDMSEGWSEDDDDDEGLLEDDQSRPA
jgi:hypothetical protein